MQSKKTLDRPPAKSAISDFGQIVGRTGFRISSSPGVFFNTEGVALKRETGVSSSVKYQV